MLWETFEVRVHVDGEADDEILAGHLADTLHDGAREAHAVPEAAAPLVVAAIVEGQPELVDNGIVGGEEFYAVKARLLGAAGSLHETIDNLLDLGFAHGVAAIGIVKRWQSRRRPGRLVGIVKVTVLAHVIELMADDRAVAMHSVGDLAEMRNDLVGGMAEISTGENGGAMHRHGLDDDHAAPPRARSS